MNKKTIFINSKPFTFEDESNVLSWDSITAMSEEEGKETLLLAKKLLAKKGLKLYLTFGTLLGAVREHTFIKGDTDVDTYVTDEDTLYSLIPYLYDNNLKLCRMRKGVIYTFRANKHSYIDIYILRPLKHSIWSLYCLSLANNITPKKYFVDEQEVVLFDEKFYCPLNPERLLEFWYGRDWRIPQSKKGQYEVFSAYIWHTILSVRR